MPTYRALGITASLHRAELDKSCASVTDFKGGEAQREDAQRISHALHAAIKLPERPLRNEVLHFVGDHEDIPLFAVQAGPPENRRRECGTTLRRRDSDTSSSLTDDSILSARLRQPGPAHSSTQASPSITQPVPVQGPQALVLNIETCSRSFLPSKDGGSARGFGKDLKFEVFLNGTRAAVCFVPRRGGTPEFVDGKLRFCGTRAHRQIEVPWVYDADSIEPRRANEQWEAVSASLAKEAQERGRNRWSDPSPSAEALFALAQLVLPQDALEDGLGLVDLVITAGNGKKYGPDGGCLTGPARMIDSGYSTQQSEQPALYAQAINATDPAAQRAGRFTSPEVPLALKQKPVMPDTPSKRRKIFDLSSELALSDNVMSDLTFDKAAHPPAFKHQLSDIADVNAEDRARPRDQVDPLEENENLPPAEQYNTDAQSDVEMTVFAITGSGAVTPSVAESSPVRAALTDRIENSFAASPSLRIDHPRGEKTSTSARKSSRTANRTVRPAKDTSWESAVKSFKVPELCQESVVSIGGQDSGHRQISIARNGEFKETCVVVVMRFVVV